MQFYGFLQYCKNGTECMQFICRNKKFCAKISEILPRFGCGFSWRATPSLMGVNNKAAKDEEEGL